jgi:PIN domain nuclease of toxin-antitoxin system
MAIHIMDASAITAYLRGEAGDDAVEEILLDSDNVNSMHAVNMCEVYYDTLRASGQAAADQAVADVTAAGVQLRDDMDPAFWQLVGQLKVSPGRMSLADCFGLALSIRLGGAFVTADHHEFDVIAALGTYNIQFVR